MEQNFITLLELAITIFIAFITAFFTNRNENRKQTTVFFKQEGIKEQKEILDFWCSILFTDYDATVKKYIREKSKRIMNENNIIRPNEITDTMAIKAVQKDSYMYSSKLTLKYIGSYMQEIFKSKEKQNIVEQMFLVGKIISNMKYDFTGEKTSVIDLLKIKINDLDLRKKLRIYWYEVKYFFKSNYIRL